MAACGWYPDPSGARGRFRYWDGDAWSAQTTLDPRDPPPRGPSPLNGRRSDGRGWAIGLVVLAILTVVAVVVLLTTGGSGIGGGGVKEDPNSSTPTVSAWDETSTPTPTTPPPPTSTGGVWVNCPNSTGQGDTRQHAGRVSAAGLSFAEQSGYSADAYFRISMVYDAHATERTIPQGGGYWSDLSVGLISFADGFTDMAQTAMQAMQCWSMTYHPVDGPPVSLIAGESMTITGHDAWHIQWQINYTRGEPIPGEILDVIVVDMGPSADYFGVFISCRPLGRPDFDASINAAIASLRVN